MRMWRCNPVMLCTKHLLGNHVEDHMFLGTLRAGTKVDGYIRNNLFEPLSLKHDHDMLAAEMTRRGMNHKTPLNFDVEDLKNLSEQQKSYKIDRSRSLNDLISRCPDCKKWYDDLHGNNTLPL